MPGRALRCRKPPSRHRLTLGLRRAEVGVRLGRFGATEDRLMPNPGLRRYALAETARKTA